MPSLGGASSDALSLLDGIQKRVVNIVSPTLGASLQPLSICRDVASLSLFYKFYHGHCSAELSSLFPPPKVSQRVTRFSSRYHSFTAAVPLCRKSFYFRSFFPRTSSIWSSFPLCCFPAAYDHHSFKSRVNSFLSHNS